MPEAERRKTLKNVIQRDLLQTNLRPNFSTNAAYLADEHVKRNKWDSVNEHKVSGFSHSLTNIEIEEVISPIFETRHQTDHTPTRFQRSIQYHYCTRGSANHIAKELIGQRPCDRTIIVAA